MDNLPDTSILASSDSLKHLITDSLDIHNENINVEFPRRAALNSGLFTFSWWRLLWCAKIATSCLSSAMLGYYLVQVLRNHCKKTEKLWKLTFLVFAAPVTLHVLMSVLFYCGICGRVFSDCLSFGFVAGIILKLASKPTGKGTVKLIVQQINGKNTDVWLDSTKGVVGEVRNIIAETLSIVPASRVSIESGKGTFLDDLSKPLFSLLDDSAVATDFFGFVTSSCYVSIKEEDLRPKVSFQDAGDGLLDRDRIDKKSPNPFRSLLRSEIKYGDSLNLTAKIDSDAQNFFHVNLIDKFAAAAPASMQLPSFQVKLQSWSAIDEQANAGTDAAVSETAESVVSSTGKRNSKSSFFFSKRKYSDETAGLCSMVGKAVHNGDTVVIEAGGRYMSVTRGWWMAWSSSDPRRSGAFVVELIERAPQNKLKEIGAQIKGQIDNIKEKIGSRPREKDVDNVLRPGDMFRLRSVKFPEFELGITSVKLKDEFCYLGLRKIGTDDASRSEGDGWCMGVRFSVRNHALTNELFKI